MAETDHEHVHLHVAAWPRTWAARVALLAASLFVIVLNATGLITQIFGVNTAIVVVALGAVPLGRRAWAAIRARRITYDITIAIAAAIAAIVGEWLAAAEVMFIVLAGDALEHWAMHRADRAIANLLSIQPDRASVIRDGREQSVAATDVKLTDRVVVRGGERIPVDGVVIHGEASVDQALVTGESIPVSKTAGGQVYAGTILEHGAIEVRPERVGTDSTVARIARLVADARRRRPPIVRTADRLSRMFLPAVLGSAVLVYLITGEPLRAAAVLVVSCSCALVYAAPTAFAAALARLAREGILVKGGDTLESLKGVTAVAFDKTGTLTAGRPTVTDVIAAADFTTDEVLAFATSIEYRSEHALARAITHEAARRGLEPTAVEEFTARPGRGVSGVVGVRRVAVGSPSFVRGCAPSEASGIEQLIARARAGETHVLVAIDDRVAGLIAIQDTPRPDAAAAIEALERAGIKDVYLITGDDRVVADAIASAVGIDASHVYANQLPEDKLQRVRDLAASGARVLMVGDGVNDAPSLAAAHVGAAFGRGAADLSAEAAQVVLLEPRLPALADLIVFACKTVKRVEFNIVAFALGVNALAILAAGLGYLKPAGSALLHQFVSLFVILGSVSLLIEHRVRDARAWSEWGQTIASRLNEGMAVAWAITASWWGRHRGLVVRAAIATLAVAWLVSGVIVVHPEETATVLRFGRLADANVQPGLHVRAPWPIETITRLAPKRVRVVEIGFRSPVNPLPGPLDLEWNTPHGEGQVRQVADENLVLTGDENLSELYAVVHYAIGDSARYLFAVRDGDALVRMVAEGTLRTLAANYPLDTLLTTDRNILEARWTAAVRARLEQIGAGVDILGIHMADVHPPVEVVEAFRDVASAEEERVMRINEADAYTKEAIPLARGAAKAQLEQAAGYKVGRIAQSEGDASRFLSRLSSNASMALTMFRLQMEAIDAVLPQKRMIILDDQKGGRRSVIYVGDGDILKFIGGKPPQGMYDEEER